MTSSFNPDWSRGWRQRFFFIGLSGKTCSPDKRPIRNWKPAKENFFGQREAGLRPERKIIQRGFNNLETFAPSVRKIEPEEKVALSMWKIALEKKTGLNYLLTLRLLGSLGWTITGLNFTLTCPASLTFTSTLAATTSAFYFLPLGFMYWFRSLTFSIFLGGPLLRWLWPFG